MLSSDFYLTSLHSRSLSNIILSPFPPFQLPQTLEWRNTTTVLLPKQLKSFLIKNWRTNCNGLKLNDYFWVLWISCNFLLPTSDEAPHLHFFENFWDCFVYSALERDFLGMKSFDCCSDFCNAQLGFSFAPKSWCLKWARNIAIKKLWCNSRKLIFITELVAATSFPTNKAVIAFLWKREKLIRSVQLGGG